jgi:hypothetical protein
MAVNKRITAKGRQYLLDILTGNHSAPMDVDYHLFKSDITPTQDDTNSTYSGAEANFTGYASVHVAGWGASYAVGEHYESDATQISFAVGASPSVTNNIYGYYATPHSGTDVLWAARFDGAPYAMDAAGKTILVDPSLSDLSEFA